jgi:Septum formation
MVASTGVNTGIHHEQVDPETAPAEPAGVGVQEAGLPEAALPDGVIWEAGAGPDPELAQAELAETEQAELAEAELAVAELAEAELAEAEREGEGRDMSPWAVAAIILVVIVLVGVAAGVLAVVTHGFHKKTLVTYRPAAVFKLRPGDCINSAPNGLVVTVLSCGTSHEAEVFATYALPKSSWPGNTTVEQDAGDGCASRLGAYLNPDLANAGFAQEFVYPNQTAWQAGERTVVCEVSSSTGNLTGSVRKAS